MLYPNAQPRIRVRNFFLLTFAISWLFWLPQILHDSGVSHLELPFNLLAVIGAWGPSLSAIALLYATGGLAAVGGLLKKLLRWRLAFRWYLFVLFWPIIVSLAVTLLAIADGHSPPDFANAPVFDVYPVDSEVMQIGLLFIVPMVFVLQTLGSSLGEELGWRGLALPLLQSRYRALAASLLIGLIWGLWHLPYYWLNHGGFEGFIGFLILIILDAVIYTWLYNRTQGSLLLVVMFHTSQVMSSLFISSVDIPLYRFIVTLLLIAYILRTHKVDLGLKRGIDLIRGQQSG